MSIRNFNDFSQLKDTICSSFNKYKLEHILAGLRETSDRLEPFIIAGVTNFAVRYCPVGKPTNKIQSLPWHYLKPLADLVAEYLLADPITFDRQELENFHSSNPVFVLLRHVGNQFPYRVSLYGQYARSMMLYYEIPSILEKENPANFFDIKKNFERLTQCSLLNFIKVGVVAFSAAKSSIGFTRGYFKKAKEQGLTLPEDKELKRVLGHISAYPEKFKKEYDKYKDPEEIFSMYNFNPIFIYPLIRPWHKKKKNSDHSDRFIAPLPDLIAQRVSSGIYYQLFNHYKERFSKFFGSVFEYYVGEVLKNSLNTSSILITEKELRDTYPSTNGKVPDFVIIEESTAILLECKATRFLRAAISTGQEEAIKDSLKQVIKGLKQLYDFLNACKMKSPGLERLYNCNKFKSVLITFEPLYLINSAFFREYINNLLIRENIPNFGWSILSIEEIEILQPHLENGLLFGSLLESLDSKSFNEVLKEISIKNNKTFANSFLYKKFNDLYNELGIKEKT